METLPTAEPKIRPIVYRYGLIAGMLLIIYGLILQFTELYTSQAMGFIPVVLLAAVIVLAYRDYKGLNAGFMSYGQGLGIGAMIGLLAGVMSGLFTYAYIKFVDDTMMTRMAEIQQQAMEEKGMSEEQIQQAVKMAERFSSPEMILLFTPLWNLFVGFILALIIAAAMRNPRPEFE